MSKKTNMTRRQFAIGAAALSATFSPQITVAATPSVLTEHDTALAIPPLIDSRAANGPIDITIQNSVHRFVKDMPSATLGYNGSYLGPTIRMYQGENTRIRYLNQLDEPTTVHGHGLHVPGEVDGGTQLRIAPGAVWDVTLPIVQQASSCWYHPHLMGTTARQVHGGLAGFYLIEDENSQSLNLPNTYGIDDIPIILQDRNFIDGVMVPYPNKPPTDLREDTLIVNGTLDPVLEVPAGLIRLRLLNGANGRAFEVYRSDNQEFQHIATEGGLLETPVSLDSLKLSAGERNEIVIDMSQETEVEILTLFLSKKYTALTSLFASEHRVLRLRVNPELPVPKTHVPRILNTIKRWKHSEAVKTRHFDLEGMEINGARMDPKIINERVTLGELEIWTIDSGRHPFHMHGTSFQILSINGAPPPPELRGWKDTIDPRGQAEILVRFEHTATDQFPYMYHCHILEHEDHGMMGQFTVL